MIHTWAETCGLLEALNVAEKICLTKHMAYKKPKNAPEGTIEPYKEFKKKHNEFKSPKQITNRKKSIPQQLERIPLKVKAFEVFLDIWTTNPDPKQNIQFWPHQDLNLSFQIQC